MEIYFYKSEKYDQTDKNVYPIYVNNFGYYKGLNKKININRPLGRKDFQLIFVSSGKVIFEKHELHAGDYLILTPNKPQRYTYTPSETSAYYWIHFTGYEAYTILNKNNIIDGINKANGHKFETDNLFRLINDSLTLSNSEISSYTNSLFYSLLLLLSLPSINNTPFLKAVRLIEDLSNKITIKQLAKTYNMTEEHFIRSFKKVYGKTPQNYKINYQLSQAKNLLLDTELSALNISEICGFNDYYYFSRLFKKYEGVSPLNFRKNLSK